MVVVVFGCKGRCAEFSRQRGSMADLRFGMSVIRARNSELVGFSQKINVGAVNDRPYEKNLEIGNLAGLELKLQFISDKGDEFRIRGLALGIADGIAEKSLQSVQVTSVPGDFDCAHREICI